ncbi:hypothetical protein HCN44_004327 [Aphidius gifuensis]|uniref:Potassium channel domain-containing protein n=1 Tax=Aphidius gifuensis TaxID=684658 RepID=A0A834XZD5_APHGI|nr:uncharacterized protein LOC122848601 isoform X2 [Aphidius gifuensis]KAF7994855.1 hypothetical protein HCN44_004327 [Aphidius gifuensis]
MEVPTFPLPPSPLELRRPPSSAVRRQRDVVKSVSGRIRHVSPVKNNHFDTKIPILLNNLPKKRAHRLSRLANTVHPRDINTQTITSIKKYKRTRITQFRVKMTERRDDEEDDGEIVCTTGTPVSFGSCTISEDLSVELKDEQQEPRQSSSTSTIKSTGVQTHVGDGPYRLRIFPIIKDTVDEEATDNQKLATKLWSHIRFIGRILLCQIGLAWVLLFWTIAGAAAFYITEGPRERAQVFELKNLQKDLAVDLATELRQLKSSEDELEPLWSNKVAQYVAKHEKILLQAVNAGYGEGGNSGQLWTLPGCFLFSVSLITTLGFGAPVPRTTPGRIVAVIFAAIGIPLHFLLVLNIGLLLAIRLQKLGIDKKYKNDPEESSTDLKVPKWVRVVPFILIGFYYTIGILCFGTARLRPLAASLLFPLDFTAAGGLATTSGLVRIFYGIYLEGAVTIAAVTVAVLRVSATESLTNIGLKYGLLTEA